MGNQITMRRCQPSEAREVLGWIKERHYLRSTPPGFVVVFEFRAAGQGRVGAMVIGRPTARVYDPDKILELTRMFFVDDTPRNTESNALSMMRGYIRRWFPQIRLLLAYSDPSVGHRGTIYQADGWAPFGQTRNAKGHGWESRAGRRDSVCSKKIRWVRTP